MAAEDVYKVNPEELGSFLRPCPFCGGTEACFLIRVSSGDSDCRRYSVYCPNCGKEMIPFNEDSSEGAAGEWNARQSDDIGDCGDYEFVRAEDFGQYLIDPSDECDSEVFFRVIKGSDGRKHYHIVSTALDTDFIPVHDEGPDSAADEWNSYCTRYISFCDENWA